jgi:hypothetical protein
MNQQVAIKDLLPNPFRNMEHYKINEKKVEQLIKSFETTGIWPVIIGRKTNNGKVELAFGHHRKEAARQFYNNDVSQKIEIIISDLSDEEMLKMMANENQQDFATSFVTEMETVQAVVQAFADGKIQLEPPLREATSAWRRCAPSFILLKQDMNANCIHVYSPLSIAKFLGWTQKRRSDLQAQRRVKEAIRALELIEQGYLQLSHIEEQGVESCFRIIRATVDARNELQKELEAAQEYADRMEADFQKVKGTPQEDDAISYQHKQSKRDLQRAEEALRTQPAAVAERVAAYERADKRKDKEAQDAARAGIPVKDELPSLNDATEKLRRGIENVLTSHDKLGKMFKEIMEFREEIDPQALRFLALALGRLCKRSERYVVQLGFKREQIKSAASKSLAA